MQFCIVINVFLNQYRFSAYGTTAVIDIILRQYEEFVQLFNRYNFLFCSARFFSPVFYCGTLWKIFTERLGHSDKSKVGMAHNGVSFAFINNPVFYVFKA